VAGNHFSKQSLAVKELKFHNLHQKAGDCLHIRREAANMSECNKQSRTACMEWSSSLGAGRGTSNPSLKIVRHEFCHTASGFNTYLILNYFYFICSVSYLTTQCAVSFLGK